MMRRVTTPILVRGTPVLGPGATPESATRSRLSSDGSAFQQIRSRRSRDSLTSRMFALVVFAFPPPTSRSASSTRIASSLTRSSVDAGRLPTLSSKRHGREGCTMTTTVDRRHEPLMIWSLRLRTPTEDGTLLSPDGGVVLSRPSLNWRGHRLLKRGCSGER